MENRVLRRLLVRKKNREENRPGDGSFPGQQALVDDMKSNLVRVEHPSFGVR